MIVICAVIKTIDKSAVIRKTLYVAVVFKIIAIPSVRDDMSEFVRKAVLIFSIVIKPLVMDMHFVFPGFSNFISVIFYKKHNI